MSKIKPKNIKSPNFPKGKNKKKTNTKLLSKIPIWLHYYAFTIREKKRDFLEWF